MTSDFDIVIMTTQASGTPHAAIMQAANPGTLIHTCTSPHGSTHAEVNHLWRNCDRNIHNWWRDHSPIVTADSVLFLEYDVYCDIDLSTIIPPLPPGAGIAAASIVSPLTGIRKFWPFQDLPKLPRHMQSLAVATAPLAVLLISRAALDAIQSPEYENLFASDIFCELRLPTLIRHAGFDAIHMDLPDVTCTPRRPTRPGLWHPVKQAVPAASSRCLS